MVRGALSPLGLTEEEERVYRAVLARPRAALSQIAFICELQCETTEAAVRALEAKGLLTRGAGGGAHLVPARPDIAISALLRREYERLDRVHDTALRLAEEFRQNVHRDAPEDLVEVIDGRDAVTIWYEQAQRAARSEILQFDTPPYASAIEDRPQIEVERLRAGITYRTIYDAAALDYPGQLVWIERVADAGEQSRCVPHIPIQMVLVDHEMAILPLSIGGRGTDAALVVYAPVLLKALHIVFENYWDRSVPVYTDDAWDSSDGCGTGPSAEDRKLLSLVASGMKDEAIAYRLGLSPRTLRRRLSRIMAALGADNRFQAGYQVARRGWLEPSQPPPAELRFLPVREPNGSGRPPAPTAPGR